MPTARRLIRLTLLVSGMLLFTIVTLADEPPIEDAVSAETATVELDPSEEFATGQMEGEGAAAAEATLPAHYHHDLTFGQLLNWNNYEQSLGPAYGIMDLEVSWTGSEVRYTGIWYPVNGLLHWLIQGTPSEWNDFWNDMAGRNGRWLDVEVGYFGDFGKRYTAIFLEDGDDYGYELRTTTTDAEFQSYLDSNLQIGRQIIDFEAYTIDNNGTDIRYAGVWVSDPNQPRTTLYYGLREAELADLLDPQLPVDPNSGITPLTGTAGRPIDFERYWSPLHGEHRFAVIMAQYPGALGQWAVWWSMDEQAFNQRNDAIQALGVKLISVETWNTSQGRRFAGVWGDTYKSLHEVDAIPEEFDPEPRGATLDNLITQFESSDAVGPLGMVGFYAKNLRTNQTISYRATQPFYQASVTKWAVHIKLWQEAEAGNIDLDSDTMQYTLNANTRNPWYVDNRDPAGLGPNNFGQSFSLRQLDQMMMVQSDNAATSMLVEMILGRENLNTWLAGVSHVGRGYGVLTGITDLDRVMMWQGQVNDFPDAPSYFLIPSWRWEPTFRGAGDQFGDLQAWANANNNGVIPPTNWSQGRQRYFRMGLNSAEPRAFGRLIERFLDGFFLNDANTLAALNVLGNGTPLDNILVGTANAPGMPPLPPGNPLQVWAKNGGKGSSSDRTNVANDTAVIQKGPDTIVIGVFSQDNARGSDTIRNNFMPTFGYQLFRRLIADLKDRGPAFSGLSTTHISPGGNFTVHCDVINTEGGDALPYQVRFYLSPDATISGEGNDILLGPVNVPGTPGHTSINVAWQTTDFPNNIPFGDYTVGWIIDPANEVGEWDDRLSDNQAVITGQQLEVAPSLISPYRQSLPLILGNE